MNNRLFVFRSALVVSFAVMRASTREEQDFAPQGIEEAP